MPMLNDADREVTPGAAVADRSSARPEAEPDPEDAAWEGGSAPESEDGDDDPESRLKERSSASARTPVAVDILVHNLWTLFTRLSALHTAQWIMVCVEREGGVARLCVDQGKICLGIEVDGALYCDEDLRRQAPKLYQHLQGELPLNFTANGLKLLPVEIAALCELTTRALTALALRLGRNRFFLRRDKDAPLPPTALRFPCIDLFMMAARAVQPPLPDTAARLFHLVREQIDDAWLLRRLSTGSAGLLPIATQYPQEKDIAYARAATRIAAELLGFFSAMLALQAPDGGAATGTARRDERLDMTSNERPPLLAVYSGDGLWCVLSGPVNVCLMRVKASLLGRVHELYLNHLATENPTEAPRTLQPNGPAGVIPTRLSDLPTAPKFVALSMPAVAPSGLTAFFATAQPSDKSGAGRLTEFFATLPTPEQIPEVAARVETPPPPEPAAPPNAAAPPVALAQAALTPPWGAPSKETQPAPPPPPTPALPPAEPVDQPPAPPPAAAAPILAVLSLRGFGVYAGARALLPPLDLELPPRGITALVGPSGSGKSTLLRTLSGVNAAQRDLVVVGEATYRGQPLGAAGRPVLTLQSALLMMSSVHEYLIGARPDREALDWDQQRQIAGALLERGGLASLRDALTRTPLDLSLCQRRQLTILRGAALAPALLCVDEPVSDLPPADADEVIGLLRRLATDHALLLVLRDAATAARITDTVVDLPDEHGRSHKVGRPSTNPLPKAGGSLRTNGELAVVMAEIDEHRIVQPAPSVRSQAADAPTRLRVLTPPEPSAAPRVSVPALRLTPAPRRSRPTPVPRSRAALPRGFHWLWPQRLGGCPQPGITNDLRYDLELLRDLGVTVLVTLLTEPLDQPQVEACGLRSLFFPIEDMRAPQLEAAWSLCQEIAASIDAGNVVAVHCKAGLGRTGTILAAQLITQGTPAAVALARARRVEPQWVQSSEQERFLERYDLLVASKRK